MKRERKQKKHSMLSLILKMRSDSRGSTLIEVVVSVLIVGIAFVPLMIGLNAALKVNKQSEVELYAENSATNLLEICKTYGQQGMDDFAKNNTDDTKNLATVLSGVSLTPKPAGSGKYEVTGIVSGTGKKYAAKVQISLISGKQNDFSEIPTIENMSGNNVVVSFGEDKLDQIVEYFWTYAKNVCDTDVPEAKMKKKENVRNWLKRDLEISVDKEEVEEGGKKSEKIVIKKVAKYSAIDISIDGDSLFKGETLPEPKKLQETIVNKYSSVPETLIVTYKPVRGTIPKDDIGKNYPTESETILVSKSVPGNMNVYAFCEDGAAIKASAIGYPRTMIKIDDTSAGDWKYDIYSNFYPDFDCSGATGCTKVSKPGSTGTEAKSRVKNLEVAVYEADEDGKPVGDPLVKKNTSFIETES